MKQPLLLSSASVLTLLSAVAPALAQTQPAVSEVLVTAERRTQSVQKSSLAISVVSPEALKQAGVTQARDLTKIDPGVQIGQGGPATQIYIRGIGDFGSTPITNPAVATNIDGVYVARSQSIEGNFFDLERIEVVKGPQGTLYGRNASGGALNIITNKPRLGEFGGDAEIEIGNFSLVRTEAALNIPLGDNFAVRGAMQVVSRDGYAPQDFDDDHHEGFRLSALWKPDERLSIRATADYEHVGGNGPSYAWKGPLDPAIAASVRAMGVTTPTDPRTNGTDPAAGRLLLAVTAAAGACVPNALLQTAATASGPITPATYQGLCPAGFSSLVTAASPQDARQNNKFTNFSVELNYDLGFATLTVLPAYRKVRNDYTTFPLVVYDDAYLQAEKSDTYSFEARLGHVSDTLTWVAGLYYFRENQKSSTGQQSPWLALGENENRTAFVTESRAVFGQATFSLSEQLRLIAGARYTKDDRQVDGLSRVFAAPISAFQFSVAGFCYQKASPCITDTFKGQKSFDSTTGKLGVEYDLSERNMLFLTYATGQKAGGFNESSQLGSSLPASYGPEKVKAWELGSRNRFFDNRLQVNAELFHWKYDGSQQTFSFLSASGQPKFGYTNAGAATMKGGSLDVTGRPTAADTVHVGVEYLKSNFDEFVYSTLGLSAQTTTCKITQPTGTQVFQTIDCSGKPLIRAPEWSGSASYTHTFEFADGGALDATVQSQFATERWMGVDYLPAMKGEGYWVTDLIAVYHSPQNNWSVSGYIRNIGDELVYTGSYAIPSLVPSYVVANLAPPRTWGARLSFKF